MNIVTFIFCGLLFLGGIVLCGYAWDGTVFSPFLFAGGLFAITLGVGLPGFILSRADR